MNDRPNTHGIARAPASEHLRLGNFGMLLPLQNPLQDPPIPTWAEEFGIADRAAAENIANVLGGRCGIMRDANDTSGNSDIPAAYTFFAQFVDHDITLDAESELTSEALTREQVEELPNLRSASLDLDSVYGFGPDVSPHLYDRKQPWQLLVGSQVDDVENPNDVPRRADGTALIGDPRNDENIFLSQMHLLFLRFHNRRIIDLLIRRDNRRGEDANQQPPPLRFEDVQRDVRYHYQALVLYDFLQRICDVGVYNFALQQIQENANGPEAERDYPFFLRDLIDDSDRLRMPVEFSAAAYRFGHTLVRSNYPANSTYPRIEIFDERLGTTGLRPIPPELTVDWRFLLDVNPNQVYVRSKAIDHLLANELVELPERVVGPEARRQDFSLAFRNLLRGYVLGLPSGQRVEAALVARGYPIEIEQDLGLGEILEAADLDAVTRGRLEEHTPLFLYLMREAGIRGGGNRLGPVGSAILMEVFGAMLVHCDTFLRVDGWTPDPNIAQNGNLTLADIVRYVNA